MNAAVEGYCLFAPEGQFCDQCEGIQAVLYYFDLQPHIYHDQLSICVSVDFNDGKPILIIEDLVRDFYHLSDTHDIFVKLTFPYTLTAEALY
jgi:hypothetical protein